MAALRRDKEWDLWELKISRSQGTSWLGSRDAILYTIGGITNVFALSDRHWCMQIKHPFRKSCQRGQWHHRTMTILSSCYRILVHEVAETITVITSANLVMNTREWYASLALGITKVFILSLVIFVLNLIWSPCHAYWWWISVLYWQDSNGCSALSAQCSDLRTW